MNWFSSRSPWVKGLLCAVPSALCFSTPVQALDGATARIATSNGWRAFEVITQGNDPSGDGFNYAMPGTFDGAGARLDGSTLRIELNHETSDASVSEVNLDLANLKVAIDNVMTTGNTGGVRFVLSARQAYDRWSSNGGSSFTNTSSTSNTSFSRFCSGQTYAADTFGPDRGFVDPLYITGEETEGGRLIVIDSVGRTLYQLSGTVGSAPGGIGGMSFDSWENNALLDTGETEHVALLQSPDGGTSTLKLYIGDKGKDASGGSSNSFLARNGLAYGRWFYLNGSLPGSVGATNSGNFDATSSGALSASKMEDIDTSPSRPDRVVLGNQSYGVFTFDFDLVFSGSFDAGASQFRVTKISNTSGGNNSVDSPDNVDWTAATTLGGVSYPDGLIFVNEDNSSGEIWRMNPDGSGKVRVGATTVGAESTGIQDISELVGFLPGSIVLTNSQGSPSSMTVLVNPAATRVSAPRCGDQACDANESPVSCPVDCPDVCGDGLCSGAESTASCAVDCPAACPTQPPESSCGDGIDNDCDGLTDGADPDCCADTDGDGFRASGCGGDDCDDGNPSIHPGAAEVCSGGVDDNCNGVIDCAEASCTGVNSCPSTPRTVIITDLSDAFVSGGSTGSNYGSSGSLEVDTASTFKYALIKPNSLSNIQAGAQVVSAELVLNIFDPGDTVQVQQILGSWNEGSVTWSNAPAASSSVITSFAGSPTREVSIDITALAQSWVNGAPMNGVRLYPTGSNGVDIRSSEYGTSALRPYLVLEVLEGGGGCSDNDGDGHASSACGGDDCNDSNASMYPGATEVCTDGVDNDCDGPADCADSSCSTSSACSGGQPRTVFLTNVHDAFVSQSNPNNNYGNNAALELDTASVFKTVFIKPTNLGDIAPGAQVVSAELVMRVFDSGNSVQVRQILGSWSEGSITWNTAPSVASDALSTFSGSTGEVAVDVTALMQSWVNGTPAHGVNLYPTGSNGVDIRSSEYGTSSQRPYFVVEVIE